jgi:hypothetical protein
MDLYLSSGKNQFQRSHVTVPQRHQWPSTQPSFGNMAITATTGKALVHMAEPLVHRQAQWMYHLSRLEYIPAAILSPWITNLQLKQADMPLSQRTPMVRQEVMRQVFGIALNTITFFAGGSLSTPLLKGLQRLGLVSQAVAGAPLSKFIGGMLASTLAFGLLRPFLLNSALLKWMYEPPDSKLGNATIPNSVAPLVPVSAASVSASVASSTPSGLKTTTSALSFMGSTTTSTVA